MNTYNKSNSLTIHDTRTKWLALAKLYISLIVMLFDRSCFYESKTIVWQHMTSVSSKYLTFSEKVLFS